MRIIGIVLHGVLVSSLLVGGVGLQLIPGGHSVVAWWVGVGSWLFSFFTYSTLVGLNILKRNS